MITVIIAGGSGTRLWPLSTPDYPKHLLKPLDDRSLLQHTYDRAKKLTDKVFVITDNSHVQHVADQLPELQVGETILSEPGRRGTASCIVYALAHIVQKHDASEPVIFMHADHLIRDTQSFVRSVKYAMANSKDRGRIVLLGVEPTYPATGFGYIERGEDVATDDRQSIFAVESFKEKPDIATANKYVVSGRYLWNMGYFAAPIEVFVQEMQKYAPHMHENMQKLIDAPDEKRAETYLAFEEETIDIALIEKVKELFVVPGAFDWMDIGSYTDLHAASPVDDDGNYMKGNVGFTDVNGSYIVNQTETPVAVIGLDNVVVINTPEGILVASKAQGQKIKDVAKQLMAKKN
jgi:mannose-1-phosphate guanylyltransferase/mannose-6-phosphate isomerase